VSSDTRFLFWADFILATEATEATEIDFFTFLSGHFIFSFYLVVISHICPKSYFKGENSQGTNDS
jgi:hypothetical protein